jgi:hypothetical protein
MNHCLTDHGFTMWTPTLPPITIGCGYLEADATLGQLYRFNTSISRSCSHAASPEKVGSFLYSSSNQHFNRYNSCLQLELVKPSL